MSTENPMNPDEPAFPFNSDDERAAQGLTAQEYAAIQLRVPESGTEWLDAMIRKARRMDTETTIAAALIVCDDRDSDEVAEEAAGMALLMHPEPGELPPEEPAP